jgi:hypothetical protein
MLRVGRGRRTLGAMMYRRGPGVDSAPRHLLLLPHRPHLLNRSHLPGLPRLLYLLHLLRRRRLAR